MDKIFPKYKSRPFKVPDNYFEDIDAEIFSKLNFEETLLLSKESGHKVPDNYFENLEQTIFNKLEESKETKVVAINSKRNFALIASIAASLLLIITLIIGQDNPLDFEDLETASIESYLSEKDMSTYEMAQILGLNDIDLYNVSNADVSESSLEEYLLENAILEDLYQD